MNKVYIVMMRSPKPSRLVHPIAVFEDEAEATRSADGHADKETDQQTWVEEVNYYRKED